MNLIGLSKKHPIDGVTSLKFTLIHFQFTRQVNLPPDSVAAVLTSPRCQSYRHPSHELAGSDVEELTLSEAR